jgi:hypothetical protein
MITVMKIKIRKSWGEIDPRTKVFKSKITYIRKNKWGNHWDRI